MKDVVSTVNLGISQNEGPQNAKRYDGHIHIQ